MLRASQTILTLSLLAGLCACSSDKLVNSNTSEPSLNASPTTSTASSGSQVEFPWPAPKPSAFASIPSGLLVRGQCKTLLRDVSDRLEEALDRAGYEGKSWFAVPNGFAIVTRLERIHADGQPLDSPDRWSEAFRSPRQFSIRNYVSALFTSKTGFYRVIVFVVTDSTDEATGPNVTEAEGRSWYMSGEGELPRTIGKREFTVNYHSTALIYEFEQRAADSPATFRDPSAITANAHLERSMILENLRK